MSDPYGHLAGLLAALQAFDVASMRTGRSTRLYARLQPGDQLVVHDAETKTLARRCLDQAGIKDVRIIICAPRTRASRSRRTRARARPSAARRAASPR